MVVRDNGKVMLEGSICRKGGVEWLSGYWGILEIIKYLKWLIERNGL
jgi:hypothetical protein